MHAQESTDVLSARLDGVQAPRLQDVERCLRARGALPVLSVIAQTSTHSIKRFTNVVFEMEFADVAYTPGPRGFENTASCVFATANPQWNFNRPRRLVT